MKRKYIKLIYDDVTQKKLRQWCYEKGFDITQSYSGRNLSPEEFEFHTTIFYSSNESSLSNKTVYLDKNQTVYRSEIDSFALLGDDFDIPVIKLKNSGVISVLRELYESIGLEDEYDEYIPHISISYVRSQYYSKDIELPKFPLVFDKLRIEDIEE